MMEKGGGGTLDRRTDVFSLGALAYELVAGFSPWADDDGRMPTQDAVGARIALVDPEPLTRRFRGFPEEVWAILRIALSKAPQDRFSSMAVFAERLRRARATFLAQQGLPQGGALASLPSLRERSNKPRRSNGRRLDRGRADADTFGGRVVLPEQQ